MLNKIMDSVAFKSSPFGGIAATARNMLLVAFVCMAAPSTKAATDTDLWSFWSYYKADNMRDIDHSDWSDLLKTYVVTDSETGLNGFRYADFNDKDRKKLDKYIKRMAKTDPRKYNRTVQKAYWLNLHNALTVQVVLENYPLKSVKEIRGEGMFAKDAWDKKLVTIEKQPVSLNDIEHRILRPIWQDHRIHFGLNCASRSCPGMQPLAFTAKNTQDLLKQSGRDFINHPAGVELEKDKKILHVSSLFKVYQDDFAKDEKALKKLFAHYADDRLALYLLGFSGKIEYRSDSRLNEF